MVKFTGLQWQYLHQYFGTIAGALITLSSSLALGWYPPTIPKLPSIYHISEQEVLRLAQIFQVGSLFGVPICGYITKQFGRKVGMLTVGIPHVIGLVVLILISEPYALYLNRILAGYTFGGVFTVVPAFICEISSPEIRGVLSAATSIMVQLSVFVEYVLVPSVSYNNNLMICLSITIISWLVVIMVPESPYWLLSNGKSPQAEKSLKFYRKSQNVYNELLKMTLAIEKEKEEKGTYWDLLAIATNRKALWISFFVFLTAQLTGCNSILQYSQSILIHSGSTVSKEVSGMVTGATNVVFSVLVCPLTDILGRKPLIIVSCLCLPVPYLILGLFFYLKIHGVDCFLTEIQVVPLICLIVITLIHSLGLVGVPYIYMSELFPTNVRAQAGVVVNLYSNILVLLSTTMYQVMTTDYGFDVFFFTSSVICLVLTSLAWFILVETKGLSLEEIQKKLKVS